MERVPLGRIVKAQGVKGEVKVAGFPEELISHRGIKYVYIDGQRISVRSLRVNKGFAYMGFSTITDRNQAETFRNKEIFADRSDLLLPEGRYFIDDIIGCKVVTQYGEAIGEVYEIMQNPTSADVYVLKGEQGEIMFPFLKKALKEVDPEMKRIVVKKEVFDEIAVKGGEKEE